MSEAETVAEDETDLAIKIARTMVPDAMKLLLRTLVDEGAPLEARLKAADILLGVAGGL